MSPLRADHPIEPAGPPAQAAPVPRPGGFTLVELLVVVAIIALLLGILVPVVGKARQVAMTTRCLSNVRNMQIAHQMYMAEWKGAFIRVGLAHDGVHGNEAVAWINTLEEYYGNKLMHRSPVDDSPYWPVEEGGDGMTIAGEHRRTSYGVNNYLDASITPLAKPMNQSNLPRPSSTVHFLIMVFGVGDPNLDGFATADHPHAENWGSGSFAPIRASRQLETDAHGGPERTWQSISNYGFIDGHAETLGFEQVYRSATEHRFNPLTAW